MLFGVVFSSSSSQQLEFLLAVDNNSRTGSKPLSIVTSSNQHPATVSTHMSNAHRLPLRPSSGELERLSSLLIDVGLISLAQANLRVPSDVEDLVNACLDTSGIDRRYSAIILEELRDCTNLTHDQLREAAYELTTTLGSNSPQYASMASSTYDSAATTPPSPDEHLYDSPIRHVQV